MKWTPPPGSKSTKHSGVLATARRVAVPVGPDGAEHDASVFVARAEMIDESIMPMRSYRDPIVSAARANGLPAEYVDELARTPVADP